MNAQILLLEQHAGEAALIQEAIDDSHLSVVRECADILAFLRRQGKFANAPRPDLVLLDLVLSRTEDCKVLAALKKDPLLKRLPVVVLASAVSYEEIFEAYDLHANAYLCKPGTREEFLRVLRATLHFWLNLAKLPRD